MLTLISKLSAKIGKDLSLIQGGGGNTSIKEEDSMWVKASGKWLSDAETENIFVSVNYIAIRKHNNKNCIFLRFETHFHSFFNISLLYPKTSDNFSKFLI